MNNKTGSWLLIFFLTGSIFSGMFVTLPNNNTVVAGINPSGIFLIDESEDYITAGLDPDGLPVYTEESLIDFYMPIALKKEDVSNLQDSDIAHTILHGNTVFNNRLNYIDFTILSSDTYWVVLYHMNVDASNKSFSIDFVPKIKGEELPQFAWWNSSYSKRKTLSIDNTQVPDSLKNFPVLVYIGADTDMFGVVQNDLDDIVFVSLDNSTIYNHEIDNYTIGANFITAFIWVNITYIAGLDNGTNTQFYMFYGNAGVANSQENVSGVWDTNYTFVGHLNSTTTSSVFDSTANANHATIVGDVSTSGLTRIGGSLNFDGTDDYLTFPDGCWLVNDTTEFGTHESWTIANATDTWYAMMQQRDDGTGGIDQAYWRYSDRDGYRYDGHSDGTETWFTDTFGISSTNWEYHAHAMKEDDVVFYDDGNITRSDSSCYMPNATVADKTYHGFGSDFAGNYDFNGSADEIRISNIRRNDSWIVATYNSMANLSTFVTFGEETVEADAIDPISSFVATTNTGTQITLTWINSPTGNYTYIERHTQSNWVRGTGTFVYNNTGTSKVVTGLTSSVLYYFGAWAFNESLHVFSDITTSYNHTGPTNPVVTSTTVTSGNVNITWTKGSRADKTVILRKTDSYPTDIDDGTELYNGSATGYDDTGFTTTNYYKLFGWNTTNSLPSSGTEVNWGKLDIHVYDENTSEQIYNYTVFITNQSGTETYEEYSDSNPVMTIDLADLPTGANVVVKINASVFIGNYTSDCESWNCTNMTNTTIEYKTRIYIMDIYPNNYYNLSAYLPRIVDTESYIVRVIDESGDSVGDAKVKFQRYINATVGFEDIGIYHTDANGYLTIDLFPGEIYLLEISKSGFNTATPFMYPIEVLYIEDRYHVFEINHTTEDFDVVTFNTVILFCSETSWVTANDTLHISFYDKLSETTDITIHVYESYETNLTFNYSYSYINTYDIDIWVSGLNTSRMHRIKIISMNHTTLGHIVNKSCDIMPIHVDDDTVTETELEDAFRDAGGDFSMGWVNMIILFIPSFAILIGIGKKDPGFGVLVAGMYFILCSWYINLIDATTITLLISMLIPLGVIVIAGTRGKKIT